MDSRPHKRPRPSHQASYHDPIPFDHDYAMVYAREDPRTIQSTPVEKAPLPATDAWEGMLSWAPPDDSTFALDPDGGWYDVAVESHVMDEIRPLATLRTKKGRSMVSVSSFLSLSLLV